MSRNFEIRNIKMKKDGLFDPFIFELLFYIFQKLFEHPKYLIIFDTVNIHFSNGKIEKIP